MHHHRSPAQLLESATGGQPVPRLAKAGAAVMATGLLLDLVAHTVLHSVHHELEAWVDHETFLVLRTSGLDPIGGVDGIREVVRITFGPQEPSLFELPADASPRPPT